MKYDIGYFHTPIRRTSLSTRAKNSLIRGGIRTIGDLVYSIEKDGITGIRGIGASTRYEVRRYINQFKNDLGSVIQETDFPADTDHPFDNLRDFGPDEDFGIFETMRITESTLSTRVRNSLQRAKIKNVGDLIRSIANGDMNKVRNIGEKAKSEVWDFLKTLGVNQIERAYQGDRVSTLEEERKIIKVLRTFPLSLWVPFLTEKQYQRLLRNGYSVAFQVIEGDKNGSTKYRALSSSLKKKISTQFEVWKTMGELSFLDSLLEEHRTFLTRRLSIEVLHPRVILNGKSIRYYQQSEIYQNEVLPVILFLCLINQSPNITFELTHILSFPEREIEVFISRHGSKVYTLEEIGEKMSVTRERIRQIEGRITRQLWQNVNDEPNILLKSALKYAEDQGKDFTFHRWIDGMKEKDLLAPGKDPINQLNYLADEEEFLLAIIYSSRKDQLGQKYINDDMRKAARKPSLSVGSIELVENVPKKNRRQVKRKIAFTGGIHVDDAASVLTLTHEDVHAYLSANNITLVKDGWYSVPDITHIARSPIRTAGLKMIEGCPPLSEQEFLRGVRKYISRHNFVLSPKAVVRHMFKLLGFMISTDIVHYSKNYKSRLNDSEKLFLQLLSKYDNVISFYELVTEFLDSGFSKAGATIGFLSHSPLPVNVDNSQDRFTYYTLRGLSPTWDQVQAASTRQIKVSAESEVTYCQDGCIIFTTTLNTWAVLSGVLAVHRLPDLSGEWSLVIDGEEYSNGSTDENFFWGLTDVMRILEVNVGDRIEVVFNTWDRTATFRMVMDEK